MEDLKLNQTELGAKLGYGRAHMSNLLKGHECATQEAVDKLAEIFSVEVKSISVNLSPTNSDAKTKAALSMGRVSVEGSYGFTDDELVVLVDTAWVLGFVTTEEMKKLLERFDGVNTSLGYKLPLEEFMRLNGSFIANYRPR